MSEQLSAQNHVRQNLKKDEQTAVAVSLIQQEPNKPLRDALGRLLPGQSANPRGRPKINTLVQQAARQEGLKCILKLIDLRDNGRSEKIQLAATQALLDRGFGRPREMKEEDDAPTYADIALDDDTLSALMKTP